MFWLLWRSKVTVTSWQSTVSQKKKSSTCFLNVFLNSFVSRESEPKTKDRWHSQYWPHDGAREQGISTFTSREPDTITDSCGAGGSTTSLTVSSHSKSNKYNKEHKKESTIVQYNTAQQQQSTNLVQVDLSVTAARHVADRPTLSCVAY